MVASTVGHYRAQGLALVQACAEAGTDYADLTGEVLFIRDSIDHCHDAAARSGARIVHCCGFDSVPSDLGVLLLHQAARADGAGDLQDTTLVVTALRGGISGGTLASLMGQQEEVRASAVHRQMVQDPYALSPDRAAEPDLGREHDLDRGTYDGDLRMWVGPFAMAGINTRGVRRSNALQGWAYGRGSYREVTGFGAGPAAPVLAAMTGAARRPRRRAGVRAVPGVAACCCGPGQGPGENTRRSGYFRIQIHTRTSAGVRYLAAIEAQGDPGYAATSATLGEAALCLALDRGQLPGRAGVLRIVRPRIARRSVLSARPRRLAATARTRSSPAGWRCSRCQGCPSAQRAAAENADTAIAVRPGGAGPEPPLPVCPALGPRGGTCCGNGDQRGLLLVGQALVGADGRLHRRCRGPARPPRPRPRREPGRAGPPGQAASRRTRPAPRRAA